MSGRPTTFDELVALLLVDYRLQGRKSLETAENSIDRLRGFFGGTCRVDEITYPRLMAYALDRMRRGRKPATVRKELAALKRSFHLARRADPTLVAPVFPEIHVDNARQGFIDRAGYERLLEALPGYLRGVLTFLFVTGWRRTEVLTLRWSDVDWESGVVRLRRENDKNGEGRAFPFRCHAELRAALERQAAWTDYLQRKRRMVIPFVFHKNGKRMQNFRKAWARAKTRAGVDGDLRPHDFRRTAARNFDRGNVRRGTAMKLMGHKTESIFLRYSVGDHADLEEGVARVDILHREDSAKSQAVLPLRMAVSRERLDAKPSLRVSRESAMNVRVKNQT